jgi:hypothetical protein
MSTTSRIEGILAFAEALRRDALAAGCDLNAANLLVHGILWRVLVDDDRAAEPEADAQELLDEVGARLALVPLAA